MTKGKGLIFESMAAIANLSNPIQCPQLGDKKYRQESIGCKEPVEFCCIQGKQLNPLAANASSQAGRMQGFVLLRVLSCILPLTNCQLKKILRGRYL